MNQPAFSEPLTYAQAQERLQCSRNSLYRMIAAGVVIREYWRPPKGMPRVFIPTGPVYHRPGTASGEEIEAWQKSTPAQGQSIGGRVSRIRGAAKRLDDLLVSPPSRG